MNRQVIIGIIIGIVVIGAAWIQFYAPARQVRAVSNQGRAEMSNAALVQEIAAQVPCPDACCAGKGIAVSQSDCAAAQQIRAKIEMMINAGLTKEGVFAHLKMLGVMPGDPGLPEGHPPVKG